MSDDDYGSNFSTRRVSLDEMNQLKDMLNQSTTELKIEVTSDVLARIDSLLPKMEVQDGSPESLQFAMAVRQIFMAGLYSLERELGDE